MDQQNRPPLKPACPSRQVLAAFDTGSLTTMATEGLAEHVAGCRYCEGVLRELRSRNTELAQALRQGAPDDAYAKEQECAQLEARARALHQGDPNGWVEHPIGTAVPVGTMRWLGNGPNGAVYLASRPSGYDGVAVKIVPDEPLRRHRLDRFRRRMARVSDLPSSRVLRILGIHPTQSGLMLLMPYIEGDSLAKIT